MDKLINWSEVSRRLTPSADRSQIRSNYKGEVYKEVIQDIKEIAKLIDLRIETFNEPKGLNQAIEEIELRDNLKEIME
jgi:hypothetical protein